MSRERTELAHTAILLQQFIDALQALVLLLRMPDQAPEGFTDESRAATGLAARRTLIAAKQLHSQLQGLANTPR